MNLKLHAIGVSCRKKWRDIYGTDRAVERRVISWDGSLV